MSDTHSHSTVPVGAYKATLGPMGKGQMETALRRQNAVCAAVELLHAAALGNSAGGLSNFGSKAPALIGPLADAIEEALKVDSH